MYERFDPRVGLTRAAAQTWWDILGNAMLARGEISPKLTLNDVFDLAGEMLASQDGIGYFLMESRFQFRAVDLMTAMILIAIVGYATEKVIVDTIEKRTLEKWEVQAS